MDAEGQAWPDREDQADGKEEGGAADYQLDCTHAPQSSASGALGREAGQTHLGREAYQGDEEPYQPEVPAGIARQTQAEEEDNGEAISPGRLRQGLRRQL